MPADRGHFLIGETRFNKATNSLVAEVMKMYIGKAYAALYVEPDRIELIRVPLAIVPWFTIENQVCVDGANRMIQCLAEKGCCFGAQWNSARHGVLRLNEAHHSTL